MLSTHLNSALRRMRVAGYFVSLGSAVTGCSSNPDLPPLAGDSPRNAVMTSGGGTSLGCSDGATRSCSTTLGQQGLVLSCFYGTQTCISGSWSECTDGTVVLQAAPPSGGERLAALSAPKACDDNPCDPTCQRYTEVPGTGLVAQPNGPTWQTGTLTTEIQNRVSTPACKTAADCQQNQHCVNVATDSTCGHSKCQVGQALSSGCVDSCVTNVCAQMPECCHPCNNGELLSPDGTRCYHNEATKYSWDDARVNCRSRGNQWDLVCINTLDEQNFLASRTALNEWVGVHRVTYGNPTSAFICSDGEQPLSNGLVQSEWPWSAGEPNYWQGNAENCALMYNWGRWNDQNCNDQFASWCEGPPAASAWSNTCVSAVASICGSTCDTSGTGAPATCQSWAAGQTNSNDQGPDLAIDVPCNGQIPVCNHGTAVAPIGAVVHVLPTTAVMGALSPDTSTQLGSCASTSAIAPGACVMVNGCTNLLSSPAHLWVGYTTVGTEARTDDNWGYNLPGMDCGAPQCVTGSGACFASTTKTYDYEGKCPNTSQIPQWSFLSFNSSTPGDSSIEFSATAAPSQALLASEPAVVVANVTRANGNELCGLAGPAPNCPVNLYNVLLPNATTNNAFLRLTITLNPSSDGSQSPVLSNWKVSYSCPAGT